MYFYCWHAIVWNVSKLSRCPSVWGDSLILKDQNRELAKDTGTHLLLGLYGTKARTAFYKELHCQDISKGV